MGHYHRWEDFPERGVYYLPGMEIKVRIMSSERMMLTNINAKKGVHIGMHHHEAEQIILLYKGEMRVRMHKSDSEPRTLKPGDIWIVPSNCPHAVDYVQDTEALEIVSPPRLDNFVGYTVSHTYFEDREG
ncbi:MAG TPA: cupin domain-containing protein [Candidatus Sulfotelmatobacter sp.]|nr:cupin domain-containing protein [Candidatus Sulfotelmatobacter sp.]